MRSMGKTYKIGATEYSFSFEMLKKLIREYKSENHMTLESVYGNLASAVNVSSSTVENWHKKKNAPNDVETIELLSDALGYHNYQLLLQEEDSIMNDKITVTNEIIVNSVKRISDAVMDFLSVFRRTDGFNNYWFDVWDSEKYMYVPEDRRGRLVKDELYTIAEKEEQKVLDVFEKERLYISKHPISDELDDYLYGDEYGLWQIYDGKLDYACRFEAGVENVDGTRDTVTTDEDYQRYYKKLCEIIKKYLT